MILGINEDSGKVVLARCYCSHNFFYDCRKYPDSVIIMPVDKACPKCKFFPWRIKGMDDEQLKRPTL